jgi:hypothetical protein
MQFPRVSGSNLDRKRLDLPGDFAGEINIVLVAFQQWQQAEVDTWIPAARELEARHGGVRYYELPVIQRYNRLARVFINEGMRAGIPDPVSRARTVTLYLDKPAFRQALEMPDEEHIYVLVVDRLGKVLWRERAEYSDLKGAALVELLQGTDPTGAPPPP